MSLTEPGLEHKYKGSISVTGKIGAFVGPKFPVFTGYSFSGADRLHIGGKLGFEVEGKAATETSVDYTTTEGCPDQEPECLAISSKIEAGLTVSAVASVTGGHEEYEVDESAGCPARGKAGMKRNDVAHCWDLKLGAKGELKASGKVSGSYEAGGSTCEDGGKCEYSVGKVEVELKGDVVFKAWILEIDIPFDPDPVVLTEAFEGEC